ncbi:MAG: Planctomycete cytochrome [Pedosphaera sp.]|nr:Planctomycete cytochrome [Pedosphaera sp.]
MSRLIPNRLQWTFWLGLLPGCLSVSLFAAEVDSSKLPPAAQVKIDFTRDIKPILENSCLRCHGPEKPKSRFRLDSREAALKGGENGVDILPDNSAKSPLILYVARLVPDMEMPPPDKGKPLTQEQISLLRTWIDQGLAWETAAPVSALAFSVSPTLRWTTVSGNEQKFREHYWQREGWNGGLERFDSDEQLSSDSHLHAAGHFLLDDYRLQLALEKNEVGFVHTGWEQYRKYYSDTGGYYPAFAPPASRLGRDLHVDTGRAWIDFGLTLPDWPRMVLGYEYQYRNGEESTLQWGDVVQNGIDRKIAPASQQINEHAHIIKFDLEHAIAGVRIEDSFRGEYYNLNTSRTNSFFLPAIGSTMADSANENYKHFQGANTFRLEKQFSDWLFTSGGYLYSKLSADTTFNVDTLNISGPFPLSEYHAHSQQITLSRESHVLNLNALLGPWEGLNLSGGVLSEWTRQRGFGNVDLDEISPGPPFSPIVVSLLSDLDKASVEESAALRYTRIPFTTLFAEVRLRQESIGQFEEEIGSFEEFLRKTDFSSQLYDLRAGFSTSPWQWVSLSAHYRRSDDSSNYHHTLDEAPIGIPGSGYSAFILGRDLASDEVETKIVLRPLRWLKTTLSYKLLSTDYRTDTEPVGGDISPGGQILAGKYDSHIYSLNTTITPYQRLYLATTFSYQDSTTITANNGSTAIVPYRGDVYSALVSGTYVLSQVSDLFLAYSFSYADFSQGNFGSATAGGLPVGIRYQPHGIQAGLTRRIGKNLITRLQYNYFYYDEPTSGTINNYTAHALFATLTYTFH